jgi:fucose permease
VAGVAFWLSREVQWVVVVLGFLLGGLMFTIYGISVAHVNDMVDAKQVLETTGGLLLVHGIGAALGPTLAGALIDLVGPEGLMLHMCLVLSALALFAVRRIRAHAPVPAEAKFDFVMMGTGSPAVVQLAPEPTESAKPPDAADPTKPAAPP